MSRIIIFSMILYYAFNHTFHFFSSLSICLHFLNSEKNFFGLCDSKTNSTQKHPQAVEFFFWNLFGEYSYPLLAFLSMKDIICLSGFATERIEIYFIVLDNALLNRTSNLAFPLFTGDRTPISLLNSPPISNA